MSVIRQPNVLGRHTRRRLLGTTAALSATTFESLAVGSWFFLVVLETRTISTALAGLGLLFCGILLRTGVFGVTTKNLGDLLGPRRLAITVFLSATWVTWLIVAEAIGSVWGLLAGGVFLVTFLSLQLGFERWIFRRRSIVSDLIVIFVPATLLSIGATTLLATTWFVDWSVRSESMSIGFTSLYVYVEAVQIGFVVFVLFAFLAHYRRFQRTLDQ